MGCSILDLFYFVHEILFNLAPNTIHKNNGFCQVFFEKDLKLFITWRYGSVTFNLVLVLLLAQKNPIFGKESCKRFVLVTLGASCLKTVLVLRAKIVAFYMQGPIVQIWFLCLERPIQSFFLRFSRLWQSGIPLIFHKYLYTQQNRSS